MTAGSAAGFRAGSRIAASERSGAAGGTSYTLAFKGTITKATSNQVVIGASNGSAERLFIGGNSSGQLAGGVGSRSVTQITGGGDITNVRGVGVLTTDGATDKLYWQGAEIYSGAIAGAPTTAYPFRIGANNSTGTANTISGCDLYHALAIARVLMPSEIQNLTNWWGTE